MHIFGYAEKNGQASFHYKEDDYHPCNSTFSFYETVPPFHRAPLYDRMQQLAA